MQGFVITLFILLMFFILHETGKYGEDTWLGYRGSILVALLLTPITALIIIWLIKR